MIKSAGPALKSRQQISWTVEVTVTDDRRQLETAQSSPVRFEMGLLKKADWKASWIASEHEVDIEARKPAPYLRRTFAVGPGLASARIYQTAHGLYHFWLNGAEGTGDCFKPGLTSYYRRIQYQVYDITKLLHPGANVWAVVLGDGWWRGTTGGTVKNNFGYRLHYFGQIELTYHDGRREIIGTDESFKYQTGGLRASDMLMGDIYDASCEPAGWKQPGFNDNGWEHVHVTDEEIHAGLIASRSVPVREKEEFSPYIFIDGNGAKILDFGQNIAGYVRMRLRGCHKGQKIKLIHGEDLKDGRFPAPTG